MSLGVRVTIYQTPVDEDRISRVSALLKKRGFFGIHRRSGDLNRSALYALALEKFEDWLVQEAKNAGNPVQSEQKAVKTDQKGVIT